MTLNLVLTFTRGFKTTPSHDEHVQERKKNVITSLAMIHTFKQMNDKLMNAKVQFVKKFLI